MLYQLSYASPKPLQEPVQCADTPLLTAYHGTEIKVSIAAHPEQTREICLTQPAGDSQIWGANLTSPATD